MPFMLVPLSVLKTGILILQGLSDLTHFLLLRWQPVHVHLVVMQPTMYAPCAISGTTAQEVLKHLAHLDLLLCLLALVVVVSVLSVLKDTIWVVVLVFNALQDILLFLPGQHRQINACTYAHHLLELVVVSQEYW